MRNIGQLAILVCAVLATSASAQVMGPSGTFPQPDAQGQTRAVTPPPPPAAKAPYSANASPAAPAFPQTSSNLPPSLLDQPAQPAQVELSDGKLSIEAHNSSLSAILHQISSDTGMKVEGFAADQRIFGTYGPAAPREVLLSLLEGSGYNVVMMGGTAKQAPLRLELSSPTQVSAAPVASTPTQAYKSSEDEPPSQPTRAYVFPRQRPQQPERSTPQQHGVRTPQQLLEQLQELHRREMQQEQQQQQPQ